MRNDGAVREDDPFNSFPVAAAGYHYSGRYQVRALFQFFPSCSGVNKVGVIVESTRVLSILSQLQPVGYSAPCRASGFPPPFNSFPVAAGRLPHAPEAARASFQFFPSCSRWMRSPSGGGARSLFRSFNSFPVAARGWEDGDPGRRQDLSILSQLQRGAAGGGGEERLSSFNSFPVAAGAQC